MTNELFPKKNTPLNQAVNELYIKIELENLQQKMLKTQIQSINRSRHLTAGEIAMARPIFGNAINYAKTLVKHSGSFHEISYTATSPFGNMVFPPSVYKNTPDFSLTIPKFKYWFIHEMTHVWQQQNGLHMIKCAACEWGIGYFMKVDSPDHYNGEDLLAYKTDILGKDKGKKFKEFDFEQQARIIEMWYDATYLTHEEPSRPHHVKSRSLQGHLEWILRDFFLDPDPKKKSHLPEC